MNIHEQLKDAFTSDRKINLFHHISRVKDKSQSWLQLLGKNGIEHSRRLENYLNEIITVERLKDLSSGEIFILLYSCYVHDIGYLKNGSICADGHPQHTRELLLSNSENYLLETFPRKYPADPPEVTKALAIVCFGHSAENVCPLNSVQDQFSDQYLYPKPMNLRKVTALLRLADEIDDPYIRKGGPITYRRHISLVEIRTDIIVWHSGNARDPFLRELETKADQTNISLTPVNEYLYAHGYPKKRIVLDPPSRSKVKNGTSTREIYVTWSQMLSACQAQVKQEISTAVGTKYIPDLYVNRRCEQDIETFINSETAKMRKCYLDISQTISRLQKARRSNVKLAEQIQLLAKAISLPETRKTELYRIIPQIEIIIEELDRVTHQNIGPILEPKIAELKRLLKPVFVIIDRAGSGKTNILCKIAEKYMNLQPVVFISGKIQITDEFSLEKYIYMKLQYYMDIPFQTWFKNIHLLVSSKDTSFLILIDAINENHDIFALERAIENMVTMNAERNLKFIITCRDIYWAFFRANVWKNHNFATLQGMLYNYTIQELDSGMLAYFSHYKIQCTLNGDALTKCRHPLLLRFFCETYGDPKRRAPENLGTIIEIRLRQLFDIYLSRKSESIAEKKTLRDTDIIRDTLFAVARAMADGRTNFITKTKYQRITGQSEIDLERSLYSLILDEDIIIEEKLFDVSEGKVIVFVYDELMEYLMAREFIARKQWMKSSKEKIVKEFTPVLKRAVRYNTLFGVIEYICVMLKEDRDISLLIYLLKEHNPDLQKVACRVIQKLKADQVDHGVLSVLGDLLDQVHPQASGEVGLATIEILERMGRANGDRAARLLGKLILFEDESVHRAAIISLSNKRAKESGAVFRSAVNRAAGLLSKEEVESICYLLGFLGEKKWTLIAPCLLHILRTSNDIGVIKAAVKSIGITGNERGLFYIIWAIERVRTLIGKRVHSARRFESYYYIEDIFEEAIDAVRNLWCRGVLEEKAVEVVRAITSWDLQQMADCFNLPLEEIKGHNIKELQNYIQYYQSPEDAMYTKEVEMLITAALSGLNPNEEKMIRMKFGIGERNEFTSTEIAGNFGMSHMEVNKILSKALEKLKRRLKLPFRNLA